MTSLLTQHPLYFYHVLLQLNNVNGKTNQHWKTLGAIRKGRPHKGRGAKSGLGDEVKCRRPQNSKNCQIV